MKSKILLLTLLVIFCDIKAQETNALWSSFQLELSEIIQIETENEFTYDIGKYKEYNKKQFIDILLNSPIERKGMDYIARQYGKDSLANVKKFALSVFKGIAEASDNDTCRSKAINYLLDFSLSPSLSGFLLKDFDEEAKQKIVKLFNKAYIEEELTSFIEGIVKDDMRAGKRWYDNTIGDSIKKYNDTVSSDEIMERIFRSKILVQREKILNTPPAYHNLLIASQLNIREVIPYLKEYVANDKYDAKTKEYAIYALACMRIEDYEDKAAEYYDIDTFLGDDTWIASIINSQKIWYAYLKRLQSEKHYGKCPVAYRTMSILERRLIGFPKRYPYEGEIRYYPDGTPMLHKPTPFLVPDDCDLKFTSLDPKAIKVVVDWMEANKGKYEVQHPVVRTF